MPASSLSPDKPGPPLGESREDGFAAEFNRPIELSLITTLLLLLTYGDRHWYVHILLTSTAFAAIAFRSLRRTGPLWSLVATALLTSNWLNYWSMDNHKHLISYWCLAVALACHAGSKHNADAALALAGKWLVAGSMAFAVVWKLRTADYLSGDFFAYTLMFDARFETVATWLGGVTPETIEKNQQARSILIGWVPAARELAVEIPDRVKNIGQVMTWWVLGIEATIAVSFAVPPSWLLAKYRDALLLVFLVTTYLVAPVYGFAYILIAMGMAQSKPNSLAIKGYAVAFVLIQLFDAPWAAAIQLTH